MISPVLYTRLKQKFDVVCVHNQGVANQCSGEKILQFGEAYAVNCPFCGDRRHRLWVNHTYGQPDAVGRPNYAMVRCFNMECLKSYENKQALSDMLFGMTLGDPRRAPVLPLGEASAVAWDMQIRPPGELADIKFFPHAVAYMQSRGFGPDVWHRYGLRYVVTADIQRDARLRLTVGSLYIPYWFSGKYIGWQCRYIGEPAAAKAAGVPKYYTSPGMQKSRYLYGLDRAAGQPYVVVVEGAPAVWRLGDRAVAMFGKTMSAVQRGLLQATFSNRQPIILVLDDDAAAESYEIFNEILITGANPVVRVQFPAGTDPADYTERQAWEIIGAQCAAAGITI